MGWEAVDELELDPDAPSASLSLGATGTLGFRPIPQRAGASAEPGSFPVAIVLASGELLVMDPEHALPARHREGSQRLNLTFRLLRPR